MEDLEKNEDNDYQIDLMNLEIARLKYLLKLYIRTRNQKIEQQIFYIVDQELNTLLSEAEFDFATK